MLRFIPFLIFAALVKPGYSQLTSSHKTPYAFDEVVAEQQSSAVMQKKETSDKVSGLQLHGFFGSSWNFNFPVNEFKEVAGPGTQIHVMDFGLFFTENFGITGVWHGGGNARGHYLQENWYYTGVCAGPIVSLPLTEHWTIDLRAMTGYSRIHYPLDTPDDYMTETQSWMFSYLMRFQIQEKVSLFADLNYYTSEAQFPAPISVDQTLSSYSLGLGIVCLLPTLF